DYPRFLEFHRRGHAAASLVLTEVADTSRYGRVQVGNEDRISGFEEKGGARAPGLINSGIYLLSRESLSAIEPGGPVSLGGDVLPAWVAACEVRGFRGGAFIDIGTPESYAEAEGFFESVDHSISRAGIDKATIRGIPFSPTFP